MDEPMSKGSGDFSIGSKVWPGVSKLLEEMGELGQVLGKLLGTAGDAAHWDGTDLRERLIEEMADVMSACAFVRGHNLTPAEWELMDQRISTKIERFERWHHDGDPPPSHEPHCQHCVQGLVHACAGRLRTGSRP